MRFTRKKITVVGAGFTGATTAYLIAEKELGDVVLVDIPDMTDPTTGKALDMSQAGPVVGFDSSIKGTSDYKDTMNSDIVIITAGMARKPGMSRDDLVEINAKIMKDITKEIVKYSPDCTILVLTNPVDAMTYTVLKTSGFTRNKVIGQSGVLDTARFRTFVASELNLSVKDITGFVLGGHGDSMVPLTRFSYAGGIPLEQLISKERLDAIISRTRGGGGEIVNLLGKGSAYYAPAAALVEMVEAILKDKRRILPTIAFLEGEYGYDDLCLGVPTILGGNGIEKVMELDLIENEQVALDQSAEAVRNTIKILYLKKILLRSDKTVKLV